MRENNDGMRRPHFATDKLGEITREELRFPACQSPGIPLIPIHCPPPLPEQRHKHRGAQGRGNRVGKLRPQAAREPHREGSRRSAAALSPRVARTTVQRGPIRWSAVRCRTHTALPRSAPRSGIRGTSSSWDPAALRRGARAMIAFTGRTTKKYTAAPIRMKETRALMNSPIRNLLPFTSKAMDEKSGFPTMAAMMGVIRSLTSAVTTAPNAAPITTATARSITLPRSMNCLKPFISWYLYHVWASEGTATRLKRR